MITPLLVKRKPDTLEEILLCCKPSGGCARPQLGKTTLVFRFIGKVSPFVLRGAPNEGQILVSLSDCLPSKIFFLLSAMRKKELAIGHRLELCLKGFSKGWPAGHFTHHSGSYSRWNKNGLAVNCNPYFLECLTYELCTSRDQIQLAANYKNKSWSKYS